MLFRSEAMLPENPEDIIGVTDWEAMTQGRATSRSLPFFGMSTGLESNHKAKASLALATASSSVSPALAHPGKFGNTADQRPACGSYSTGAAALPLVPGPHAGDPLIDDPRVVETILRHFAV